MRRSGTSPAPLGSSKKGFLWGIVNNLRNAFDKQYYSQLKHRLTAYCNITPFKILKNLNVRWCPLNVKAKKAPKDTYCIKWDGDKHLTAFRKRLDDDQKALVHSNATIADKDKLQFIWRRFTIATTLTKTK